MRLSELEPEFLKVIDDRTWQSKGVLLSEADGIFFLCPLCFKNNNGAIRNSWDNLLATTCSTIRT
jgi:multimeric flavodoxin WrbA